MIAMAVGTALALLALGYVLYPLLAGTKSGDDGSAGPLCPNCGSRTRADASFCSNCGSPLAIR